MAKQPPSAEWIDARPKVREQRAKIAALESARTTERQQAEADHGPSLRRAEADSQRLPAEIEEITRALRPVHARITRAKAAGDMKAAASAEREETEFLAKRSWLQREFERSLVSVEVIRADFEAALGRAQRFNGAIERAHDELDRIIAAESQAFIDTQD